MGSRSKSQRQASIARALNHHQHITKAVTSWVLRDDGKYAINLPGQGPRVVNEDEAHGVCLGIVAGLHSVALSEQRRRVRAETGALSEGEIAREVGS